MVRKPTFTAQVAVFVPLAVSTAVTVIVADRIAIGVTTPMGAHVVPE